LKLRKKAFCFYIKHFIAQVIRYDTTEKIAKNGKPETAHKKIFFAFFPSTGFQSTDHLQQQDKSSPPKKHKQCCTGRFLLIKQKKTKTLFLIPIVYPIPIATSW